MRYQSKDAFRPSHKESDPKLDGVRMFRFDSDLVEAAASADETYAGPICPSRGTFL